MTVNHRRVLLVEDNRADAVLLENELQDAGNVQIELVWADRLQKALERLRGERFDAVLLDLILPDSRGLATLENIHSAAGSVPILIVTGLEDEELAIQAIRSGAQDYLIKGKLDGRGVARAIQYAIDRKRVEEDLRQAQKREMDAVAAATAAQVARDTVSAMSEGVVLVDLAGRILSVNPAMECLTGYDSAAVIGRNLAEFLSHLMDGRDLAQVQAALQRLPQEIPSDFGPFTLHCLDERDVPVMPSAAFVQGRDGRPASVVITLRDITQLKRTQTALETSERKYRELVENANSIIMRRLPDGTITFFNEYAQRFFGYSEGDLLGRNVMGTIVPAMDSTGRRLAEVIYAIGRDPEAHASSENETMRKDGRRVWVQWTNRALRNEYGEVIELLCVGNDITERKRAEEDRLRYQQRLRSLATKLASTEEEERLRLARYLHDTVIQSLSLSNIKLGSVRDALAKAGLADDLTKLQTARELLNEGIAQCRQLMSDLTPPMLYELGLESALEDLVEKLQQRHGLPIRVQDDGSPKPMDKALRGLLFQSTRELLLNAVKHAGPCQIVVALGRDHDSVCVSVRDNGAGFDPEKAHARQPGLHGGFGLFNIQERLEGLGGHFDLRSTPGQGTIAILKAPLTPLGQREGADEKNERQ